MKRSNYIMATMVIILMELLLQSCIYDDIATETEKNIGINSMVVNGAQSPVSAEDEHDSFVVLFWMPENADHLANPTEGAAWPELYLSSEAPQAVSFYNSLVYDTGYPYPFPETTTLCATGYAPAGVLMSDDNYRTLTVNIPDENRSSKLGRCDFLGCDAWNDVYKGSHTDPFSQEKNKLYFRHLTAKLVFYADRDRASMENKQFVRNVVISNVRMTVDGTNWTPLFTPSEFTWRPLDPDEDFAASYRNIIAKAKQIEGNTSVITDPTAGYEASVAEPLSGEGFDMVFHRHKSDRVPIRGITIDSCYVCNPIENGTTKVAGSIQLKMDISAELSFNYNFPMSDENGGSTTDDITYTRNWKDVTLGALYQVDEAGKATETTIKEFKPGNEYRVYIHFSRTGVYLTAMELPWDYGGVHYITIPGGAPLDGENEIKN